MDNQDKLHGQFKDAARKAETKDFARMEAVWNRVEEKLDHTELKKKATLWKYTGIAATLLLFMGAGVFLLNNENNNPVTAPQATPENTVTVIDTQKVEKTLAPAKADSREAVVTTVTSATTAVPPASSDNAEPVAPEAEKEGALKGYTDAVTAAPATKSSATVNREMEIPPVSANALVAYQNTNAKVAEPTLFKSVRTVTGTITDEQGTPIPGVEIIVGGTNKKTQTNFDGIYTIDAKAGEKLVATFVGMESQVVTLDTKKDNVDFTMKDDTVALSDVVVEGYRTTTRSKSSRDPVGSISQMDKEKSLLEKYSNVDSSYPAKQPETTNALAINNTKATELNDKSKLLKPAHDYSIKSVTSQFIEGRPNANFIQTLQGQVPGLNVTTGTGQPQANTLVSKTTADFPAIPPLPYIFPSDKSQLSEELKAKAGLKNSNLEDILFVVDGVPTVSEGVDALAPDEIVAINILKNKALQSLYGERNYSDCIVINTTKGLSKKELRKFEQKRTENNSAVLKSISYSPQETPLVFVDDLSVGYEGLQQIDPEHIYAIDVLKDSTATAPYGEAGKNGIIKISIKKQYAKKVHRQMIRFNKKQEKPHKKKPEEYIPFRQEEN